MIASLVYHSLAVKEYRPKVTTEDTLRVVTESIQETVYENNRVNDETTRQDR